MILVLGVVIVLVNISSGVAEALAAGPVEVIVEREAPASCLVNIPVPCLAWFDPGTSPDPGDDTLHLYENVRRATIRTDTPVLGGHEASLDLRNESVPVEIFPAYASIDDFVDATLPDAVVNLADLDINETGIHPRYPDIDHNLSVQPETRDWVWDDNFVNYTSVHVPYTTYPRTSDYVIESLKLPCFAKTIVGDSGCIPREGSLAAIDALKAALPNVVMGAEIHRAEAQLDAPGALASGHRQDTYTPPLGGTASSTQLGQLDSERASLLVGEIYYQLAPPAPVPARSEAQGEPVLALLRGEFPPVGPPLLALALLLIPAIAHALYHRITGQRALEHPHRRRIQAMLIERPGMDVMEMTRALGLSYHTTRHHLSVLQRGGFVRVNVDGRRVLAYVEGHERAAMLAVALRCNTRREILRAVAGDPGIRQAGLARKLGLARSTVHAHVQALTRAGLVNLNGRRLHLPDAPLQQRPSWDLRPHPREEPQSAPSTEDQPSTAG